MPNNLFNDSIDAMGSPIPMQGMGIGNIMDYLQPIQGGPSAPIPQQSDSFIPQSYLNALAGLPSMQFDSMGRMGITEDQRKAAQNQGMGDMLMGVAQGFLNLDTMAPMKGGAIAGQNMQSMMDNFSKQNMANVNAILDNKIKQLTAFGLMSNLEQGQVALDSAKLKLDQDKKANAALQVVSQHYAPLVDFAADLAAKQMPTEEDAANVRKTIEASGSLMFAEIKRGNIDKAMEIFNTQIGKWMDLDPNLTKAKITQLANEGLMQVEVTSQMLPALQKQAESLGARLEIGPDGKPKFVHPYEQQLREMELKKAAAYIGAQNASAQESGARAKYYESGGNAGDKLEGKVTEKVMSAMAYINPRIAKLKGILEKNPSKDGKIYNKEYDKLVSEIEREFPGISQEDLRRFIDATPAQREAAVRKMYSLKLQYGNAD